MKERDHLIDAHRVMEKAKHRVFARRSMSRVVIFSSKPFVCIYIFLLVLIACTPAVAANPKPGNYCQSSGTLLVSAEELSTSLDLVMRSRAALLGKDQTTAIRELESAGTVMQLAASRGAAARTIMLIDAITQAKVDKDYAQLLTWFPVLHMSLQTISDDATINAADDLISRAEDSMQRIEGGDPFEYLGEARHMLACDDLDIPLHAAIQAHADLLLKLNQRIPPKTSAYDMLIESLRNALTYTLQRNEK
jgi:hypothetical protein